MWLSSVVRRLIDGQIDGDVAIFRRQCDLVGRIIDGDLVVAGGNLTIDELWRCGW
jgi:hypothetical protein